MFQMSMSKTVSLDPLTDTKSIHKWREYTRYTQTMIWAACKGEGRVKMCAAGPFCNCSWYSRKMLESAALLLMMGAMDGRTRPSFLMCQMLCAYHRDFVDVKRCRFLSKPRLSDL